MQVYGYYRNGPGQRNICWSSTVRVCGKPKPTPRAGAPTRRAGSGLVVPKAGGGTYLADNDDNDDGTTGTTRPAKRKPSPRRIVLAKAGGGTYILDDDDSSKG